MTAALTAEQTEQLQTSIATAETGEQWAEICRLEAEFIAENEQLAIDSGQFGVGA
jgi:hypothetical protein